MTTNIVATVFWVITTNAFTLTSIQSPPPKTMTDAAGVPLRCITLEYNPTTYNLSANIVSNQVMQIEWEGKQIDTILKSINIGTVTKTEYR